MASLRDLVTGSDSCVVSDGSGPSNAAASLADALLGRRAKQHAQLQELPGARAAAARHMPYRPPTAAEAAAATLAAELPALPGLPPAAAGTEDDVRAFLQGLGPGGAELGHPAEFEHAFAAAWRGGRPPPPGLAPSLAVAPSLQAFVDGAKGRAPLRALAPPGPPPALSLADQCRIRDRSTIMARQLYADRGDAFADEQVGQLLASLHIDGAALPAAQPPGAGAGRAEAFMRAVPRAAAPSLATDHAAAQAMAHGQGAWVNEFERLALRDQAEAWGATAGPRQAAQPGAAAWAEEYAAAAPPPAEDWSAQFEAAKAEAAEARSAWVDEFQSQAAEGATAREAAAAAADAPSQSRRLAETLSADPKFAQSRFLQFVSKMSRGEIILEGNQAKEVPRAAAQWADDFSAQRAATPGAWAEEFGAAQAAGPAGWADEYAREQVPEGDWATQFADGLASGVVDQLGAEAWQEEYAAELQRLHSAAGPRESGEYVMAPNNPFLTDMDSFAKGRELFRKGVLSEAVLALEAECTRSPGSADAWRLLGAVQAENDDDRQAIAALNRALAADPSNSEVLLSLGVSHANELEASQALGCLRQWLLRHSTHGPAAAAAGPAPDSSQEAAQLARLFEGAAAAAPADADLAAALGVVYSLGRRYDDAVRAFRRALELSPGDYSLWNKLGATLANSSHSGEALAAYQKALELKPNYMRAWTNMGISLANLADYEASAKYYLRALALNPRAPAVWGYLRTSLACAGRADLMAAADSEDLAALQAALPL